ncbi:MAG: hypothetical protein ACO1TE_08635 [Prosthecobacter sp.]
MHLIQILLPLYDNKQHPLDRSLHDEVKMELTDLFGGLTAYTRSPAEGRWSQGARDVKDDIVVYEIMAEKLDAVWWNEYRHTLEERFQQDKIVIRAMAMRLL